MTKAQSGLLGEDRTSASCHELSTMGGGVATGGVGKERDDLRRCLETPRIV